LDDDFGWSAPLENPYKSSQSPPEMPEGSDLHKFSKVIGQEAKCPAFPFRHFNFTNGEEIVIRWEEPSFTKPALGHGTFRESYYFRTSTEEEGTQTNHHFFVETNAAKIHISLFFLCAQIRRFSGSSSTIPSWLVGCLLCSRFGLPVETRIEFSQTNQLCVKINTKFAFFFLQHNKSISKK
jgi:hypothetical protein